MNKVVGILIAISLTACGGGGDDGSAALNDDSPAFISGKVIDGITGIPVENALVMTSPPTEARLTDRDGIYEIQDTVAFGNVYDVTARQVGYDSDSRRISVEQGSSGIADFSIVTAINGLVSSVPTLEIPRSDTSATFLLSSTIDNTGFSFTSSNPSFSVEPAQGVLTKNQHVIIQVDFSPEASESGRVSGLLVAATDNGGTDVTVNVFGNVPSAELSADDDPFEVLLQDDDTVGVGSYPSTDNSGGSANGSSNSAGSDNENNSGTIVGNEGGGIGSPTVGTNEGAIGIEIGEFPESAAINEEPPFPDTLGINAPTWRFAGSTVRVSWRNPNNAAIRIANPDEPVDVFLRPGGSAGFNVSPDSRGTGSGTLNVPFEPGTYEIRMISGEEILSRQRIEVVPALLRANDSGFSGQPIAVDIAGPLRGGSTVRFALAGDPVDVYLKPGGSGGFNFSPNSTGVGSGTLVGVFVPGDYEIRLISGATIISTLSYKVLPAILSAQTSGPSGAAIDVSIKGPERGGSTIRIANPEDAVDEYLRPGGSGGFNVSPDSRGEASGTLVGPFTPGKYEIRLISGLTIISAIDYEVLPATLTAPASGPSGASIGVAIEGPERGGSTIRIANPDDAVDEYLRPGGSGGFNVTPNSRGEASGTLLIPFTLGKYEIRLISGSTIISTLPYEVTAPALAGPTTVIAGQPFEVTWSGPNRGGSFVTIADVGVPVDVRFSTAFQVVPDSRAMGTGTLTAPVDPGTYEVRFLAGNQILNRYRITVSN